MIPKEIQVFEVLLVFGYNSSRTVLPVYVWDRLETIAFGLYEVSNDVTLTKPKITM